MSPRHANSMCVLRSASSALIIRVSACSTSFGGRNEREPQPVTFEIPVHHFLLMNSVVGLLHNRTSQCRASCIKLATSVNLLLQRPRSSDSLVFCSSLLPASFSTTALNKPSSSASMSNFQLVVAVDQNMGIGKDGTLPWKIPGDMAYFRELTSKASNSTRSNVVIMGRATWESLPPKFRPLPGRINIVLTRSATGSTPHSTNVAVTNGTVSDPITSAEIPSSSTTLPPSLANVPAGVHVCGSLQQAADLLASPEVAPTVENVFVIGGGQVYAEALLSPLVSTIHITRIEQQFACDTFFPAIDPTQFRLWSASDPMNDKASGTRYSFLCYTRTPSSSPELAPAGTSNGSSAAAPVPEQQQAALKLPRNVASKHEELQASELQMLHLPCAVFDRKAVATGTPVW